MEQPPTTPSPIDYLTVFQQAGAGEKKIQGIKNHGRHLEIIEIIDFPSVLPDFLEEPQELFPPAIQGTLVLSFLKHPDLADYAAVYCQGRGIPMIASGARRVAGALSPFTCCGLAQKEGLGRYGEQFGVPEYQVTLQDQKIIGLEVIRGASCGATWRAAASLLGCDPEEALEKVAREVQFLCQADPASFDPISGHSPLHFAGHIHTHALETALKKAVA